MHLNYMNFVSLNDLIRHGMYACSSSYSTCNPVFDWAVTVYYYIIILFPLLPNCPISLISLHASFWEANSLHSFVHSSFSNSNTVSTFNYSFASVRCENWKPTVSKSATTVLFFWFFTKFKCIVCRHRSWCV